MMNRRGSRGGEMGEYLPPFFWAPFFHFFSYPSNVEIIFDFSDIITKFTPHFKILDPPLDEDVNDNSYKIMRKNFEVSCLVGRQS